MKKIWSVILGIIIIFLLLLSVLVGVFNFKKISDFQNRDNNLSLIIPKDGLIDCCCDKNETEIDFSGEAEEICPLDSLPTKEELEMAEISWKYIENNFIKHTGLMNAAHQYPSSSVWDWANGIYAIYTAKKFKLITQEKFEEMMNRFLTTMQKMDIFNNELPNKTYNTISAKMTDYGNKEVKDGIGWSAADLARLLSALNVIEQCEPRLAPQVEKLTLRYRYCRVLSVDGDIFGGHYDNGKLKIVHETLTGYEEYVARSYELWEHNATEARRYKFLKEVKIYGVTIPTDTRTFYSNFVGSESYWYTAFDYGLDDNESGQYIKNIYQVQEERYKHTNQLTAISEDHLDRPPYFLYNTIYTNGEAWKIINHDAQDYNDFKSVSTKTAIGMNYIFDTNYSNRVFDFVKNNYDPKGGYYAGIYETLEGQNKALTLNTNSIILESILFDKMGSLQKLRKIKNRGVYDYYRNNVNNFKCLPSEKKKTILEPYSDVMGKIDKYKIDLNEAKIAWKYFEKNYNPNTGIVNSSANYPIIKVDSIGKTIIATISAKGLGIIDNKDFDTRIAKILNTLKTLPLYKDELPNRYYDAKSATMTTQGGEKIVAGRGWELYSTAHLVTALYHLKEKYPKYKNDVFQIMARFNFSRAVTKNQMFDSFFDGNQTEGLEPIWDFAKEYYVHSSLKLFSIPSYSHFVDERNLDYKPIYNYEVPMGLKDGVSEAETYLWSMMEHPYYLKYKHYSSNIFMAQKSRYLITGKIATSSHEHLNQDPYWIRNTIYHNKRDWSDFDNANNSRRKFKILSTKASFIYDALYGYDDNYTTVLKSEVQSLNHKDYGWFGGYYLEQKKVNNSFNILTNSAVLESLYYKKIGNFYYSGREKLRDKIAIHHIKIKNGYWIEGKEIELFQRAYEKIRDIQHLKDVRVERKNDNFVIRFGAFGDKKSAEKYMKTFDINSSNFSIEFGDIDSDNFLIANKYYKYDYRTPHENLIISNRDDDFLEFLKTYTPPKKKSF